MRSRLATLAWGLTALLLLVCTLTNCVAERTVPTLLLTYFALPQGWLALSLGVLLLSA